MLADVKPARSPATYEDVLAAPEHLVAEIVDGELYLSPRPATPHARASSLLGSSLTESFDHPEGVAGKPGGWWILDEPELHLGADVVVPDVAGWRRARLPAIPDVPYFELAPDWVCEVASPSTAALDRSKKMRVYARAGVAHLWLVDPLVRTVEVYRRHAESGRWLLLGTVAGTPAARIEPFDAVELDVARWWLDAP